MTFHRPAPWLVAFAAAFTLVACGGSGASTAPSQAAPTAGPTTIVIPTFDLSSLELPSFAAPSLTGDEELEALLPDTIGDELVTKSSLSGEEFISLGWRHGPRFDARGA